MSAEQISVATNEISSRRDAITAVMSIVSGEKETSDIVISMADIKSSDGNDADEEKDVVEPAVLNSMSELSSVLSGLLSALEDPDAYKNEIWTRVQRVTIDAPEQVEVHKIKADIEQTLADLLDEEQYDDVCTEPLFDADKHKEPPGDATREHYALGDEEMERFEKIVLSVR